MSVLFFILIPKMIFSLTYRQCKNHNEVTNEFSDCRNSSEINDVSYICGLYYNNVLVTLEGESEVILDLDPFIDYDCQNKRFNYYFYNASNANLTLKMKNYEELKEINFYINANDFDVIIESTDSSTDIIDLTNFELIFKTIGSKNPARPLKLSLRDQYSYEYRKISTNSFRDDIVYIENCILQLEEQLIKSLTIHYFNDLDIKGTKGLNYTFSKNQIKIEYSDNEKVITIISEYLNNEIYLEVDENSFITCENGLSKNDYIHPLLTSKTTNSISSLPTICGNWPKHFLTEPYDKSFETGISGKFFYSANNFPLYTIDEGTELVLTQKKSSIFMKNDEIESNLTISSKDDIEASLYFNGESFDLLESRDFEYHKHIGYLTTSSPKITVYASTKAGIRHMGTGKIVYKNIENTHDTFIYDSINLVKGGKIAFPYNFDYKDIYDKVKDLYDSYTKEKPENATINYYANNVINFAKDKINDLSEIINSASNKINPLNVSLKDDTENQRVKNTSFIFNRKDFPISYLYLNSVNKPQPILCFDKAVSLSDWVFRDASNIFYSHLHYYEEDADDLEQIIPKFASTSILGEFTLSDDKKCIQHKLKEVPASSLEFFVYTTNDTYIQILDKIDIITLLTSTDLDAASKLKSKNSKNIVIFVLNDIPDGKSINLKGIRKDSNVFVVGMIENNIEDLYEKIQKFMDLNDEYHYEPPNNGVWNSTEEELLETEKLKKQVEIVTSITKNYKDYQTKVSITYNTVQTLALVLVDYTGTHIKCAKFITSLSTFSKLNELSKDFYANITYTELATYKTISSLELNDLVIFPFTNDPFEALGIEEINLTEDKWSIKFFSYLEEDDGYPNQQIIFYPIETKNVAGKLYLYSGSYDYCALNVPESKDNQVLKGVSVSINAFDYLTINEIPGIFTLENNQQNEKVHKKHKKINYFKVFTDIINGNYNPKSPKASKNDIKKVNLLGNDESVLYFLGNWEKVKSIDHLSVSAGKYDPFYIAILDEINPENGVKAINITTEADVTFLVDIDEKHFTEPENIVRSKTITFKNENAKVTFTDIVFKTSHRRPTFTLKLGENIAKITTENLIVESDVEANVASPIEVTKSIELYPYSTLTLNSLTASNVVLKLNYRISGELPLIPEGFTPKEIIFNYIGEFSNPVRVIDYTEYIGPTNNKIKFTGENHKSECQAWLNKVKFESTYYPEFRADRSTVSATCIENDDSSMLTINLLKDAIGEKEEPIINVESGPGSDNEGGGDEDDKPQYTTSFETNTPTAAPPVLINDTAKKNNTYVGTIDITNKKPEEIKKDIEKAFKNPVNDDKSDKYVIINADPSQTIEFNNLELEPDQFVKVENDANVNLTSGQLNILLNESSTKVNINVSNTNDVKLSIKNMDECTVRIGAQGTEKSKVSISSNSEVYGHLKFEADENVESIKIESINLHESGSISSSVEISVDRIEAHPETSGKLSNVIVSKDLAISQSSVLELDECNLSAASVNLNLHTYTASNFDTPMLNGTFGDPPKTITLNKQEDNTSPGDQELLLFQGTFTTSCDDWKDKIENNGTMLNDKVCRSTDNLIILDNKQESLKVFYNAKLNDGDKDNKLSGGQIAGIVVGCVAGVAIIVVIVVIVIKKTRKNQESSAESGNDNQNDL